MQIVPHRMLKQEEALDSIIFPQPAGDGADWQLWHSCFSSLLAFFSGLGKHTLVSSLAV